MNDFIINIQKIDNKQKHFKLFKIKSKNRTASMLFLLITLNFHCFFLSPKLTTFSR